MLDDLEHDDFLTAWERDFLASLDAWEGDLTPAQEAKLAGIEALVEERRVLAEQGIDWRRRR